ncbi:MAG TPA: sulfotransferase [Alphaproteobacteria bacterium]|nr:sulfotransferase [Alphaproteobacteria bacterium]
MAGQVSDYSGLDRFLHRLAFAGGMVQKAAADIEDAMFAKVVASGNAIAPIFVTSLPRAGTTVLLTALASLQTLASHTYRDMPFVMAPMLWSRLSGGFQKDSGLKERAHGDGVKVGYDSPEAFEEVFWRAFWPHKFTDTGIGLWTESDADAEATAFFRKHLAKIVTLRCGTGVGQGRYISKNNANIARLDLIPAMFPDARILVPVRSPMAHAASLMRQHHNFLERHGSDAFTKRYMRDIGHLEFGELHRPIQFPGFAARAQSLSPEVLDYWLAYWIAAFEYVKEHRERVALVSHEAICNDALATVRNLFTALGIEAAEQERAVAAHFRPGPENNRPFPDHDLALRAEAEALYADLIG